MKKVLVIGATGMLGAAVTEVLTADPAFKVTATTRKTFDIDDDLARLDELVRGHQWIVNAAGITKPLIRDDNALRINSQFPHALAKAAEAAGAQVIQIATDGVFSGADGPYYEDDPHDAADIYGRSKSLGEVHSPAVIHLRCSIIGPEPAEPKYLLEWLRHQPQSATVYGFTNHWWNGITTLHFARLTAGIARGTIILPPVQHVVPAGVVTKADLLRELARCYKRTDLRIEDAEAPNRVDRTLATRHPGVNAALWRAAGYVQPPSIAHMIEELAAFPFRFTGRPRDTNG